MSPTLTTASGAPVADNQNSMTAGSRGPVLLQDVHLIEKLQHFNRERIPERVVHAKGSGAYGTFTVTHDITKYTKAKLFERVGKETAVFVRFSTVAGEKGSADTERDPRGFALKFYTEEGNWDLVGNNMPVFFIRDPIKFPDFIHTQKRDPETNLRSPAMVWDFCSLHPESLHQVTMLFSDRGTPDGYRYMNGFGSHTFSMVNAAGRRVWVKYHLKTRQGIRNLMPEDAVRLAGVDPDYAQRDLFHAIEKGDFPRWDLYLQVMTEDEAGAHSCNPFDLTRVWPHKEHPRLPVGMLELNRNPVNYHAEVEQAAFSPAHIVPGLGFSPDRMLQGRLFAYHDAQLYRLGTNHQHLPVNAAKCPVRNHQRDGAMVFNGNFGCAPNYDPSTLTGAPVENPAHREPPLPLSGEAAGRYDHRVDTDYYSQAGTLYRLLPAAERERLTTNIARALEGVPQHIVDRQLGHFHHADPDYGLSVSEKLDAY